MSDRPFSGPLIVCRKFATRGGVYLGICRIQKKGPQASNRRLTLEFENCWARNVGKRASAEDPGLCFNLVRPLDVRPSNFRSALRDDARAVLRYHEKNCRFSPLGLAPYSHSVSLRWRFTLLWDWAGATWCGSVNGSVRVHYPVGVKIPFRLSGRRLGTGISSERMSGVTPVADRDGAPAPDAPGVSDILRARRRGTPAARPTARSRNGPAMWEASDIFLFFEAARISPPAGCRHSAAS